MSGRSRGGRGGRSPQMPRTEQARPVASTAPDAATGRRSYSSGATSIKDLEFDLDGVTFRPTGVPTLDMFEMAAVAGLDPEAAMSSLDVETLKMVAGLWKSVFGYEHDGGKEYNRFKTHTARHGTKLSLLMAILSDMLADAGKGAAQPGSPSAAGRSTNVLPLSGRLPRSQQPQGRSLERAGGDRDEVSPFTPAEQREIAIRKAKERDELLAMGFDPRAFGTG